MKEKEMEIYISSAVIAAIVSCLFGYYQFHKQSKYQYITQERKIWRDELRKIAEQLNSVNITNYSSIITRLKVRLNAFGYKTKLGSQDKTNTQKDYEKYLQDEHIWEEIDILTDCANSCNLQEFNNSKNNLIMYIDLLLKYDWERSKLEITGGNRFILFASISLYICTCICYSFNINDFTTLINTYFTGKSNFLIICTEIIIFVLIFIATIFLTDTEYKHNKKGLNNKIFDRSTLISILLFLFIVLCFVLLGLMNHLFYLIIYICNLVLIAVTLYNYKSEENYKNEYLEVINAYQKKFNRSDNNTNSKN